MAPLAARGVEVLELDITDPASRQRLAQEVVERVGALDALVN
jgi:short-subunit dehydrogenase